MRANDGNLNKFVLSFEFTEVFDTGAVLSAEFSQLDCPREEMWDDGNDSLFLNIDC